MLCVVDSVWDQRAVHASSFVRSILRDTETQVYNKIITVLMIVRPFLHKDEAGKGSSSPPNSHRMFPFI